MESAFERKLPARHFKRLFVVATEGGKTERAYFERLQRVVGYQTVKIDILTNLNHSAPKAVLARIQKAECGALAKGDALWCVIDRDDWTQTSIDALIRWERQAKNGIERGLALSSPKFELWLLAHFEAMVGNQHTSPKVLVAALKRHLPDYEKGALHIRLTAKMVEQAITRCREAYGDNLPARDAAGTTVHLLVESIMSSAFDLNAT